MSTICKQNCKNPQRGFTLVELIMVIVLMGVIGGMVSVFMKSPIDAYMASGRRAALTDLADTVVRRMARDIQKSLPNSITTSGDGLCAEFIPTKTGGRYRADDTSAGLSFGTPADTSFNMLGSNTSGIPPDQQIASQEIVVVYNLGIPGSNAYDQSNTALINGAPIPAGTASAPETTINITSSQPTGSPTFPLASGSNRFQVIPANEKVVAYVCTNNKVYRLVRTTLGHICPTTTVTSSSPNVSTAAILAQNTTCTFDYSSSDLQRNALLSMRIQVTDGGEAVTLQHEVHVSNTP
jgi:MSHA biogenesis protein MshO